jgi:hypothetical protein
MKRDLFSSYLSLRFVVFVCGSFLSRAVCWLITIIIYSLFPGVIPKKFPNDGLVVQGAEHQSEGAGSIPIMIKGIEHDSDVILIF